MYSDEQELAVLNALSDAIEQRKAAVRKRCDSKLLEKYAEDGTDRARIKLNGREVGTLSIMDGGTVLEIADEEAFLQWAIPAGAAIKRTYVNAEEIPLEEAIKYWPAAVHEAWVPVKDWQDWLLTRKADNLAGFIAIDANGEVVDGLKEVQKPVRTMLRKCKFKDVAPAMTAADFRAFFDEHSIPLLEGGADA